MHKDLTLPDFLCIGAQKSATSWLHTILKYHSNIFVTQKKEVHFFDLNYINGLEWYSNHFMYAGEKIKGEITPAYALLDEDAVRFIKKLLPDLKIIFLLRNPIERAWSQTLMELLIIQKKKFEEITEQEIIDQLKSPGIFLRGNYIKTLNSWLKFCSRDQVFIGYYETIKQNPKQFLINLFKHLGVSDEKFEWKNAPIKTRVFEGPKYELKEEHRKLLKEIYKDSIKALYNELKNPIVKSWLD